jgi:hypothetical protein
VCNTVLCGPKVRSFLSADGAMIDQNHGCLKHPAIEPDLAADADCCRFYNKFIEVRESLRNFTNGLQTTDQAITTARTIYVAHDMSSGHRACLQEEFRNLRIMTFFVETDTLSDSCFPVARSRISGPHDPPPLGASRMTCTVCAMYSHFTYCG